MSDPSCNNMMAAHAAIINCFCLFFNKYVDYENNIIRYEKIDQQLTPFLDERRSSPNLYIDNEYYENYGIKGEWAGFNYADGDRDTDMNGNYVDPFVKGTRFVAYVNSSEWQYWNDNSPYQFPVVAYTPSEMKAWFVWAMKKFMFFLPDHVHRLTELIECHVDVESATRLMLRKLEGEPWELGPARKREPRMIVWHELTRDRKMNAWIRQWIN